MSSSLFYDCYAPYESYPNTIHIDGDKSFGELLNNDILYILIYDHKGYRFDELKVIKSWHSSHGNQYISCLRGKKKFNINFGPANCWNCGHNSKENSIILYNGYIIGTNKESIYNYECKKLQEEFEFANKQCNSILDKLKLIRSTWATKILT